MAIESIAVVILVGFLILYLGFSMLHPERF
jgi:hypothetical protein